MGGPLRDANAEFRTQEGDREGTLAVDTWDLGKELVGACLQIFKEGACSNSRQAHMVPVCPASYMAEVHVVPYDWLAGGVCRGSHARRAESALRSNLHLRPLPVLTLPQPFFTFICVRECERERRKREFESVEVVSQ